MNKGLEVQQHPSELVKNWYNKIIGKNDILKPSLIHVENKRLLPFPEGNGTLNTNKEIFHGPFQFNLGAW